ncbi:MAG: glutamate synthase large subunit [Candidatus Omnitrophota bacterium]
MQKKGFPKQGLYDPVFEHDSCGVGFVCDVKGRKSHNIIDKALEVLERMSHRGAVGADPKTGDGAGILIQIPHKFFVRVCKEEGIFLPEQGKYGTGLVFLPEKKKNRQFCEESFENVITEEGCLVLGWRDVPCEDTSIGETAKKNRPLIKQIFIKSTDNKKSQLDLERRLYIIRKRVEKRIALSKFKEKDSFYITNISSRTISYKGLLMPAQVKDFYPELTDNDMESAIALVHSRYSTNTLPAWDMAQPFRFLAHNGEINTLRGNVNWFRAKEKLLANDIFKNDIEKVKPVIVEGGSDSSIIDNVFELFVLSGRPLAHVMMMLIPNAWEQDIYMKKKLKDFYKYNACFMEPWDGPSAIAFTDGKDIGAVLDRNGLRPARYIVTKRGMVVMSSEVGVFDTAPEDILCSGRLEPGKMFFIDTEKGCVISDQEIKQNIASSYPYSKWIERNLVEFDNIHKGKDKNRRIQDPESYLKIFNYTREDIKEIIMPMAKTAKEPIGSMGNDTPHAVLSKKPQLLYNYFKQLFAQVTNPAIDPIREKLVMSLDTFIGKGGNILKEDPEHCHKLRIKRPILKNSELDSIRRIRINGFKTRTISILFDAQKKEAIGDALDNMSAEAEQAIKGGIGFIVLSDRGVNKDKAAMPALLAVSTMHQFLIEKGLRSQVGIILESGEPREVHHFALLFGYGVDCVNPYLAYDVITNLCRQGELETGTVKAVDNYRCAIEDGILKILSKMGISTLRSYRGAQIFEALGLNKEIIKRCFSGTVSRIGGIGIADIEKQTLFMHSKAFHDKESGNFLLPSGGVYQWKRDGEFHLWNPESIAVLQEAARKNDYNIYKKFTDLIDGPKGNAVTLRSMLRFKKTKSISVKEVEPVEDILKRFVTGAMSFGSISKKTHESIALAMNRIGARSNTGEGGEDPDRFKTLDNGDSKRSAIKQVASGRFGVTTNYLINADEIQIKIAQGAKPGEGGQLPGHKVSKIIARTRYTTPGVTLISPPPHHDIYSIEDLAQLIFDLKNVNPRARISVKLVSEAGVGTVAAGVAKSRADMILISGGDGGTGASPKSSIKHAGLPWELGLAETHQTLVINGLRNRVRLQTDGQMRTARDVIMAAILGAEEYGFCSAVLVVLGCAMLRHCHLNNCALGVATQDECLEKRFKGSPDYVVNYMMFVAREIREILAGLGIKKIEELVGRTDLVELDKDNELAKKRNLDYSNILYKPETKKNETVYCSIAQHHDIDNVMDRYLIEKAKKALKRRKCVNIEKVIQNTDRSVGAMLSGEICKVYGEKGLAPNTIVCRFKGVAGQSFGAFLSEGVSFELEGMANDYVGKGISGGKIVIYPDKKADYDDGENVIIGNTAFYGAINGEAYIRGIAGERFCVRNSGLNAVVEGVGDHACEYMTGGRVIILGQTGKNFAAGMSGGIAYVYDKSGKFEHKCNKNMVDIEELDEIDTLTIHGMLLNHCQYTNSAKAKAVLERFCDEVKLFRKVMPIEYKNVLNKQAVQSMSFRLCCNSNFVFEREQERPRQSKCDVR